MCVYIYIYIYIHTCIHTCILKPGIQGKPCHLRQTWPPSHLCERELRRCTFERSEGIRGKNIISMSRCHTLGDGLCEGLQRVARDGMGSSGMRVTRS